MNLKREIIDSYTESDGSNFIGSECFSNDSLCFILNKLTGASLIVTNKLKEEIKNKKLNPDFKVKLFQRGFLISSKQERSLEYAFSKKNDIPTFFFIELTKNCNLHCKYCFRNFGLAKQFVSITNDECDKICKYIINFCQTNNLNRISFQGWGGEPLLCIEQLKRIRENFDKVPNFEVDFMIQTNGTLLTKENVSALKKYRINVGISIDGFDTIQNFQRPYINGKGSFTDIVKGIENLKEAGMQYGLLSVITKNSVNRIEELVDFFAKDLKAQSIKFNVMRPNIYSSEDMGVPHNKISDFVNRFIDKIVSLNEEGYNIGDANIRDKLYNLTTRKNGNLCKSQGCQGGKKIISFDKYGNIYPCELTDNKDEIIGNIYQDSENLNKLIETAIQDKDYFKERKIKQCDNCSFRPFCKGGCPAAIKYANNENKIDITECLINQAIYPRLIDLILNKPDMAEKLMQNSVSFKNYDRGI